MVRIAVEWAAGRICGDSVMREQKTENIVIKIKNSCSSG